MPENDSYYYRNSHKRYPDGTRVLFELRIPVLITQRIVRPRENPRITLPFSKIRADKRAKSEIRDIVLSNAFELFCTFTFSPKKVNRFDPNVCKMTMHRWLKTQSRKYGTFRYVILPEFHKDNAIHFHALFGGYKGPLVDSGVKDKQNPVYNFKTYAEGFSTAKIIRQTPTDRHRVASYLTKYVTKDMPHFSGKKRYWASRNLQRPEKTINIDADEDILCDTNSYEK